jgi:ketosteroid isomerase-like protein
MARKFPDRRYRLLRREILPDGWVQQHVVEGTLPNGVEVSMHACCLVTMRDGRISRIEEYLDPAQAAPIRSA